ncbi:unnamed protein product [Ceutorhynchus assimilis]|uniref:Uncharacterized protein n=1 Tax=Ceutorhynchus assimilis TaxID=467358 RepID=A0A9N9QIR2_9CUCU|nr:unnamed protein product [Ceutorhynchus assimilis]
MYCSPRFTSLQYAAVNTVGCNELEVFVREMEKFPLNEPVDVKPVVLAACANMFMQYMCSTSFPYDDKDFRKIVRDFDEIFWEINQGYAVDFLPWLLPMYSKHMSKLSLWAANIREFILARIVQDHVKTLDYHAPPRDFTDALLIHLQEDPNMEWQHIIFELEDFIGGHSAIGNLVMMVLANVVKYPEIAAKIQEEVDSVTNYGQRYVDLFDKEAMPYTEAVLWETLRKGSSPIVPHVASTDTDIEGFPIKRGTMIFLNNYELNLSPEYWDDPEQFKPERFISASGTVVKPAHFIPFSTGKRTCIGQRLVQCFSFIIISTLLQKYDISPGSEIKIKPSCVAVAPDCFKLILKTRNKNQN